MYLKINKMKEIKGKVVSYSEIPEELLIGTNNFLNEYPTNCYVEVHIDEFEDDNLSKWLKENYPGIEEETFYIEIDY